MSKINNEVLKKLPAKPGVYIMKDRYGCALYIGKAAVLKNRVRQYFQPAAAYGPRIAAMVSMIEDIECIVTDSEYEALILECNLIKRYRPRFNIMLRDDKNYPYIKITVNEPFPRILATRKPGSDKALYFGPYASMGAVRETIGIIRRIFPIRTCSKKLPAQAGRQRPCLNYHINNCPAPCTGDADEERYNAIVKDITRFLNGEHREIIGRLKEEMSRASDRLEYEKAASLKYRIQSLEHISQRQKAVSISREDRDIIACAADESDTCVQVFSVREGKLIGSRHFILDRAPGDDTAELFASFFKQYYSAHPSVPREIVVQSAPEDSELLEKWLGGRRGLRVYIKVPLRGEKLKLINMAFRNARLSLEKYRLEHTSKQHDEDAINSLARLLELEGPLHRIEAYDISNTGNSEVTASMVVFLDGRPLKSGYRKFRIRNTAIQNDYASMQEALHRRLKRQESKPDLILIDGGRGHVNAVLKVMNENDYNVPVYGMVKDDRHRTRSLVSTEKEVNLDKSKDIYRLVSNIQSEAHRFATAYNRKLREKRYTRSRLDEIEGIGVERKKVLLKHFKSIASIAEATVDELMEAEGISRKIALSIHGYFRQGRGARK